EVRCGDDSRTVDEVLLGDAARLRAGATGPHLPAAGKERLEHLAERLHSLMVDIVGIALRRQPYPLDGEQDDRFLVCRCGDVRHDEWQRRSLGILPSVRRLRDELRHRCGPPSLLPTQVIAGPPRTVLD